MTLAVLFFEKRVFGKAMTVLSSSAERGIGILSGFAEITPLLRTSVEMK